MDCALEPLSDRRLVKLSLCRPFLREEQPPGDSPTPEVTRSGPSTCGASSMTDSAESEASDSANTESRGCRTSGSSESMDALEEDDLDACSSSGTGFFHFGPPGFSRGLDTSSQEEKNRIETNGFLCLLDLAQNANPQCPKTECPQGLTSGTCSWGPELNMGRLDPRLYEGSRTDYYNLCSSISPGSHLSDSSESTASRQGAAPSPWWQQGWLEAQPGSVLEALALHPLAARACEDGSSEEEFYDAADKLTPPDTLSGEPPPPPQLPQAQDRPGFRGPNYKHHGLESGLQGKLREPWARVDERNSSHRGNQGRLPRRSVKWAGPYQVDRTCKKGMEHTIETVAVLLQILGATRQAVSGV